MLTDALPAAALAVSPPTATDAARGRGPDQAALWRTVAIRGAATAGAATAAWVMARLTGRAAARVDRGAGGAGRPPSWARR